MTILKRVSVAIAALAVFGSADAATLQLPAATTAYSANTLLCTSSVAATCNAAIAANPILVGGPGRISRARLSVNDPTSTGWPSVTMQVDLWTAAPTFTNGDRGAWALATGSQSHLGTLTCTMSAVTADGEYAECIPSGTGTVPIVVSPGSSSSVFWSLKTVAGTGGGVVGASGLFTLLPELN